MSNNKNIETRSTCTLCVIDIFAMKRTLRPIYVYVRYVSIKKVYNITFSTS